MRIVFGTLKNNKITSKPLNVNTAKTPELHLFMLHVCSKINSAVKTNFISIRLKCFGGLKEINMVKN